MHEVLLLAKGICKSFGKSQVLYDVDFDIRSGEVHALIGENGAGKTTLLRTLLGIHRPTRGSIAIAGQTVNITNPMEAKQHGMAMINQEPLSFADMSVLENIFLGHMEKRSFGRIDRKRMEQKAHAVLDKLGLPVDIHGKMLGLSVAEQQMVEIAGALCSDARIIFMDEPTASLTPDEVDRLMDLIRRLRAEGRSIVYISHRLEEIKSISDRVTILCDGRVKGCYDTDAITIDEMIRGMIGGTLDDMIPKVPVPIEDVPHLRVEGLGAKGAYSGVSFAVRKGEILGIAGLMGSGRTEIARTLFGVMKRDAGTIAIRGETVDIRSPRDAIAHGIALVPEDRHELGLFLQKSIAFNTTFATHRRIVKRFGFIDEEKERAISEQYAADLRIKMPSLYANVSDLSGGNQQKVSLAKWLATNPDILILDEPTRGIDVSAKTEVYKIINELAGAGKCIIMVSSELAEVLALSDRVLVMYEGRQTALLERDEISEMRVLAAAHDHSQTDMGGGSE